MTTSKVARLSLGSPLEMPRPQPEQPPGLNEVYLFHGTGWDAAQTIAVNGFDPSRSGESAGSIFGQGAYFAAMPDLSLGYAEHYAQKHTTDPCLLICRVVLGAVSVCRGSCTGLRRPPPNCDSVVGEKGHPAPSEFVVYRSEKAYPEYVVRLSKKP